jgi:hypothetical protein
MPKAKKPNPHKMAPKRSVAEREDDLREFARLWREGYTLVKLVAWVRANRRAYSLSKTQIFADVAEIRARWKASSNAAVGDRIAEQLAEIDAVSQEAWESWRKSKGNVLETTREQVDAGAAEGKEQAAGPASKRTKAVVKTTVSHGDTRYLAIVAGCVDQRNRLLGLTQHKVVLAGPDGGPVAIETKSKAVFDHAAFEQLAGEFFQALGRNGAEQSVHPPDANPPAGPAAGHNRS